MLGVQYAWAVQVGVTTAVLLELGMPVRWVSLAWLAGPVSGLVVQPLVGLVSDHSLSRYGKRRPFVAGGALLTAASLLAFAYAGPIARFCSFLTPVSVAVVAFWCLDFSINAMQGPLRALIYDHMEANDQERGNAALATYIAAGNLLGSTLASSALTRNTFLRRWFSSDTEALYVIGAVLVLGTAVVCWVASTPFARVEQSSLSMLEPLAELERDSAMTPRPVLNASSNSEQSMIATLSKEPLSGLRTLWGLVRRAITTAPTTFWRVFLIQLGTWYGWFCLFVFGSSWFGVNVFGGDPYAPVKSLARERYDNGVRYANMALAIQSVVAFVYAAIMPRLQFRLGRHSSMKLKYIIAQLVQALVMMLMSTIGTRSVHLAMCLLALLGISWASSITIPWALVGSCVATGGHREAAGTFATLFNASQCLPEIVVAILSPVFGRYPSGAGQHNRVLASGALMVALSTFLIPFIPVA
ncbi:hypothetical protein F1559_000600 [Cyanidiococcus yangmingshanensis]|uniref:Sucrose transporter n=1 Tax=Cyanidiococcus yangmingshanensis TaxID=2690220 RepID=A0A7J7INY4_9RHOD|nr:hypothetical protein F1559_000600 [Cyanidiococcus yangmingshanensis]